MTNVRTKRRRHLDWPLLGKELLEQAAKKQMYLLRVVYAVLLFGAFCIYYFQHLAEGEVLTLGRGLGPFAFLVSAQFVAILLFLPPLMAGAIAQEKERDTLGLLFLTDLSPWELILQKYIGRLIPMLTLLFLSLPLLAVAYSLGGVSTAMLCSSAVSLFATTLVVGALALECSAHQATTFSALVRTWGLCLVFAMCCLQSPLRLLMAMPFRGVVRPASLMFIFPLLTMVGVYLVVTFVLLLRARLILEPRAFLQRRNPFAQQFKQVDQYWKDVRKLTRALLRTRDREAHVLAEQVIRRQTESDFTPHRWSPGGFLLSGMQVPNLLAFSIIVGFIVFIFLFFSMMIDAKNAALYVVTYGLWILALLTLPIQSANAVASERMNERLGPILTTPLTAPEILEDWMIPVRRWIQFLTRPLLVLFALEAFVKYKTIDPTDPRGNIVLLYLAISILTVLIYPRLVQWSCLYIGLRVRSQLRAMMTAFFAVAALSIVPLPVASFLNDAGWLPDEWSTAFASISPIAIIRMAETLGPSTKIVDWATYIPILAVHFGIAAALTWRFRHICLTRADQYLGRI